MKLMYYLNSCVRPYGVDTDEVKIGILDLPRGKVFEYSNTLPEISMLVKSEAESLLKMLSSLEG